jgi:hypothetical protein
MEKLSLPHSQSTQEMKFNAFFRKDKARTNLHWQSTSKGNAANIKFLKPGLTNKGYTLYLY